MAQRTRPPFRADHVGSLIRPPELREARQAHLDGQAASRGAARDRGPADPRGRRHAGARRPAGGDRRRVPPHLVPRGAVREHGWLQQGARRDRLLVLLCRRQHAAGDAGAPGSSPTAERSGSMAAGDFKFLKTATKATPKVMLPAPSLAHGSSATGCSPAAPMPTPANTWPTSRASTARKSPSLPPSAAPTCRSTRCRSRSFATRRAGDHCQARRGPRSRLSTSTSIPSTMRSATGRPA